MAMTAAGTRPAIKRQFRGREESVDRAFRASQTFRRLCRDYLACAGTLARWQALPSEEARLRTAEYSELLGELTKELNDHLPLHES